MLHNRQKKQMADMFDEISPHYDFLNHFLSGHIDKIWRRKLIRGVIAGKHESVLDLCSGTADVAIGLAKSSKSSLIAGVDISREMLKVGQKKIIRAGVEDRIQLMTGDALHLPFMDNSFDAVTVSFGLRNLPDHKSAITKMFRVLKPGGKLFILEFSPRKKDLFGVIYNFYLKRIVPVIGGIFSKSRKSYQYLSSSICAFPEKDVIIKIMKDSGGRNVTSRGLTFGIVNLYCGEKR